MLIGAVVRDFNDPFFAGALEVLAVEALAHGYNIVLGHVAGREQEVPGLPAVLEPRHCDAVLMLGEMEDQPQLLADLRAAREPVVALWQGNSPLWFPTVDVDDRKGTSIGLEHLVAQGHRRIGFVSARLPIDNPTREESYVAFMSQHFGGVPEGYLQRCDNSLAGGEKALGAMLRSPEAPTAVACSTDLAAVGVLHGAHSHGILVPDGLSVVGFDDLMYAAYTIPALTTLRMPTSEIVAEAMRMAMAFVADSNLSRAPARTTFDPTLVVRASTAPPRPA
jgi:DNA-binding LacI/PurR family transcriptional regulator